MLNPISGGLFILGIGYLRQEMSFWYFHAPEDMRLCALSSDTRSKVWTITCQIKILMFTRNKIFLKHYEGIVGLEILSALDWWFYCFCNMLTAATKVLSA